MTNGNHDTDKLKRLIEARYEAICAAIEAHTENADADERLRDDIAELSALMIAYADQTGGHEAISEALARKDETAGRDHTRISLAEQARRIMTGLGDRS